MKIALPTSGIDLTAALEQRFGRAARFLIYDTTSQTFELVDNQVNLNAAQGAGVQAAQCVVDAGAEVLISANCGPKAFRVLTAGGVACCLTDASTLEEALKRYQAGELIAADAANAEGHW